MDWSHVSDWYSSLTGSSGHYYHTHVIIPGVLRLLDLQSNSTLLDLACGSGVLASHLPPSVAYWGVDASSSLIASARKQHASDTRHFVTADITRKLPLAKTDFTHAAIVLALQNIASPQAALTVAFSHLRPGGKLVVVLNHLCFRIPRHSQWGIDPGQKIQYRRLDRYLSPLKIPITTHPGQKNSPSTDSFHFSLSAYSHFAHCAGFVIEEIAEWISDKTSVGPAAKMENQARSEFPLFLALSLQKPPTAKAY